MRTLLATLLTITMVCALAQEDVGDEFLEEEQEELRRYTVEIIVFSYTEDVSLGTETFPPDAPVDDELLGAEFPEPIGEVSMSPVQRQWLVKSGDEVTLVPRVTLLGEDEFTMGNIIDQFELLDVYQTMMHFGWTQATLPHEETRPIELRVFGDPPEGLEGSVRLYLSRYLHLVVDLALDAPPEEARAAGADAPIFVFGDGRETYDPYADRGPPSVRYRIQENRIVKNGEIRYFDHPRFGVVAKVIRVEEEESEDNELLESETLFSFVGQ